MTRERIVERFEQLQNALSEPYRDVILRGQTKREFVIVTDEGDINQQMLGRVDIAASVGGLFFFRPSRMDDAILDKAIVHELMHYFVEQRDGLTYADYQTMPNMTFFKKLQVEEFRLKNEREVISLTERALASINHER